jgi:hypothetical protein
MQKYITFFFWFLITYSYFKASLTSPEQPRIEKFLTMDNKSLQSVDIMKYKDCEFCQIKKFERTSHCRICGMCILRRDHHCIWIGTCVGYANNQYFVNFLLWVVVSIFIYILNLFKFYSNFDEVLIKYPELDLGAFTNLIVIGVSVIQIIVWLGVFTLLTNQITLIFNDLSYHEQSKVFNSEAHFLFRCKSSGENSSVNYINLE